MSKLTKIRLLIIPVGIAGVAAIFWVQERRDEPSARQQQKYEKLKDGFDQFVEVVPGAKSALVGPGGTASTVDPYSQVRKLKKVSISPSDLEAMFGKPDKRDGAYVWEAQSPYSYDKAGMAAKFGVVGGGSDLTQISHWVGNVTEQCGLTAAEWRLTHN